MTCHLRPAGKAAPPRPWMPEAVTSLVTSPGFIVRTTFSIVR
jgi:hypothetical protein